MWTLGPLGFATPLGLLALIGLPLIWLIIRAIPPRPKQVVFPPIEILRTLAKTEETPAKAPPWLAVFRACVMAMIILGVSGPVLNPPKFKDPRPLLLVIDNGWTAAPIWRVLINEARQATLSAPQEVRILMTAPQKALVATDDVMTPQRAGARLASAVPQPILASHIEAASQAARLPKGQRIIWFSDGIGRPGTGELAAALSKLGSVQLRILPTPAVAVTRVEATSAGYNVGLLGSGSARNAQELAAIDARGRVITSARVEVANIGVSLPVDSALARNVAALRTADVRSAGGVFLLDAFDRRVRTGLVADRQDDQPLLSDAHYLQEALAPYAELSRGDIEQLASSGLDVILLPDAAELPAREVSALTAFVEKGGILVRFAGPKIIVSAQSQLVPATLSDTPRSLRGALAWDSASGIGSFDRAGPFAGLTIPPDAKISQVATFAPRRQPEAGGPAPQIWARLSDGAPLVSALPLGRGWTVLFHTTAGPAWSDVAFSGLQVSMLRRVLARAGSSVIPAKAIAPTAPLKPVLVLDGFGNFRAPEQGDTAIEPAQVASVKPDARHPPGIYEGGGSRLILQASGPDTFLPALPSLPRVARLTTAQNGPMALGPWLLGIGLILLLIDSLIALIFSGGLSWKLKLAAPRITPTLAAIAFMTLASWTYAVPAIAQPTAPQRSPNSPADLSLAYIKTGDAATDARARAGLEGLSRVLAARTSVEPGAVIGVDPATQELALFPLLYWLLPDQPVQTSPDAARALDRYMKAGGVLFVDTRGAGRDPNAARAITRAALRGIEAPPLETVPDGHVLGKSFYILRGFPGRYQNAQLWVETQASANASANDGVSPLILGNGDWASAWANAQPGLNFGGLSAMQSTNEVAARVGVNVVLYALTGNYKADQVHFETLLKRLTPRGGGEGMSPSGRPR
jgi:hypothetical protein